MPLRANPPCPEASATLVLPLPGIPEQALVLPSCSREIDTGLAPGTVVPLRDVLTRT